MRTLPTTAAGLAAGLVAGLLVWQVAGADGTEHVTPYSTTGQYAEGVSLVSGRLITPVGERTELGDFPVAIALSPDGTVAAIANSGQGEGAPSQTDEGIQIVDVASGRVLQTVHDHETDQPTFYESGLAWSADGTHLYATGGGNDQVYDYAWDGHQIMMVQRWKSSLRAGAPTVDGSQNGGIPGTAPLVGDAAAYSRGLDVLPDGSAVLVTNEQGSTVAALSTENGTLLWETPLGGPGQPGGAYPEAVTVSKDGATAYVAAQGLNAVVGLDTATGAVTSTTPVGDHPVSMALDGPGKSLYVANANDDSLTVLDVTGPAPSEVTQVSTHLIKGEANGSTPDAVAVDDATHTVYVGNAGDNAVMVLRGAGKDLHTVGAIPTGWYPSALATATHGKLLVASAKGLGGAPIRSHAQYIANHRHGLLTSVERPSAATLAAWTAKAQHNLRYPSTTSRLRPAGSPIPTLRNAGRSPIKHVVMIVRENRTFDQVFGDLTRRDADVEPSYTEFGRVDDHARTVTPNIHALAKRFALSQNFYSDGEASIQGHHWTAEGVSSDYTEMSYLHYYSSRNHPYDPTAPIVYPRCGAVFQQLARQGKTFRNFGELVGLSTAQVPTTKVAPGSRCGTPGGAYDEQSAASFDPNLGANLSLTSVSDVDKEQEIEAALDPLVQTDQLPQFMYAVLGNDHTDGTSAGKKTPAAHVATNDLAVGRFVDYLSHTPQWKSTAVFIVEDDSQDGLDHRDGHRNILAVASPYAKRGALSSLHISQASVLHTIELILGLDPLSSYTQYSAVPYDLFTSKPDFAPYTFHTPTYPMDKKNPDAKPGSAASVPIDLSSIDVAGPMLEAQIWESVHPGVPMPPALIAELRAAGGLKEEALRAWARGEPCSCRPLLPGLVVAPGMGDLDD
ncbi:YVTN family beta-propeller protein [Nocardioides ginsengisegetis]|uniref:YVTN family beta-propeller protein n=1 Tax=Nocardioides ginsengisegetis TaxID=661491 RepID=A0A7W3IZT1_9ACTN|nr:bifunctional YncE family protein/alkaline phosphatase family protein [Nocardioides ginsengisegetis]MBA8803656.1 YVTN family beta-propeller protein [Nocardioides ginsengisegetis]